MPRVLQMPPLPPVFLVEDHEIEELVQLPLEGNNLPFTEFIDAEGRIHFEVNHYSYLHLKHLSRYLVWMFRPHRSLQEVAQRIIAKSFLKDERRLLGGMVGVYNPKERKAIIYYAGLLPCGVEVPMGDEKRRNAFRDLHIALERFLIWLGAEVVESTPCFVDQKKMRKNGWSVKTLKLKEKIRALRDVFPFWIWRKPRIFKKEFRETKLDRSWPPIITLEATKP